MFVQNWSIHVLVVLLFQWITVIFTTTAVCSYLFQITESFLHQEVIQSALLVSRDTDILYIVLHVLLPAGFNLGAATTRC